MCRTDITALEFRQSPSFQVVFKGAAPLLPLSACHVELFVVFPEGVPSVGFDVGPEVEDALSAGAGPAHAAAT